MDSLQRSSNEALSHSAQPLANALADRYRIERQLGQGGMATVYLAHDIKHDRRVAIKVLHADLSAVIGGDRFLAEIRTTAALQHPHILPLFDSGNAEGLLFYVMPLVEGDTLRDRLNKDKQLSIPEALRVATEVAGALDYAHRHNVVHRDIKPENILLQDGSAVVADFGIALAVHHAGDQRMTQTGLSLGTPQYMAPEQAMGEKSIDKRADIYALGAVLYEMLTGEPPFSGATVQAIVAKVLTERPAKPSAVRDTIPPHVEATILTALAKLPADRFATAAQFAEALARPEVSASHATAATAQRPAQTTGASRRLKAAAAAGWILAAGAGTFALWRDVRSRPAPPQVIRAIIPTGTAVPAIPLQGSGLQLSPDGSRVLFLATDSGGVPKPVIHDIATNAQRAIPVSEVSSVAAFSPDGNELAIAMTRSIRVVSLAGGAPREVAAITGIQGLAWGRDSVLTVASRGLFRVRISDGHVDTLIPPPSGQEILLTPSLTPDGKTVLAVRTITGSVSGTIVAVSLADGRETPLNVTGIRPVLVGRTLVYGTLDGTLWAVDFDIRRMRAMGRPRTIAQSVGFSITGFPRFAVAATSGAVAYALGDSPSDRELVLLDRTGRARVLSSSPRAFRAPRFSPDGKRIAVGVSGPSGRTSGDIWLMTLATSVLQRLTADTMNAHPSWEADGKGLLFIQTRSDGPSIYRVAVNGSTPPTLVARQGSVWEVAPTPDGRSIVFRQPGPGTGRDIYIASRDSGATPRTIAVTRFDEKGIALSPDGKWMTYSSNETGTDEVYIRRIDGSAQRWPVSRAGGTEPRWSRSGEIFFRRGDSVFVSRVSLGTEPTIAPPVGLFGSVFDATQLEPLWDVSPDGQQFVVTRGIRQREQRLMILVNGLAPPK